MLKMHLFWFDFNYWIEGMGWKIFHFKINTSYLQEKSLIKIIMRWNYETYEAVFQNFSILTTFLKKRLEILDFWKKGGF